MFSIIFYPTLLIHKNLLNILIFSDINFDCRGSLGQNLYAESLSLTSATFVAAMTNLVPAMTFVMAVFLRYFFIYLFPTDILVLKFIVLHI